jgi:hypothetical protein
MCEVPVQTEVQRLQVRRAAAQPRLNTASRTTLLPAPDNLTVAVLTISAILTAIMTLRTPQRGADDATTPDQPQHTSPRWPQPLAMIVYGSAILERLAWGFSFVDDDGVDQSCSF